MTTNSIYVCILNKFCKFHCKVCLHRCLIHVGAQILSHHTLCACVYYSISVENFPIWMIKDLDKQVVDNQDSTV